MSEEKTRKRPGREPGKYRLYPHQHAVRFSEEGWAKVRRLARLWAVSEAEVIRRAVERVEED